MCYYSIIKGRKKQHEEKKREKRGERRVTNKSVTEKRMGHMASVIE